MNLICIVAAALLSVVPNDVVSVFAGKVAGSRVKFGYTYSTGLQTKMTGKGEATVQGECFYLNGNGMEIYCDGKDAWTIDRKAKEVIIESTSDEGNYINPAVLISSITKAYKTVSQTSVSYAGKSAVKVIMEPAKGGDIVRMTLVMAADGSRLYAATLSMKDGSSTQFTLPTFTILPKTGVSAFRLDTSALDNTYLITDLR